MSVKHSIINRLRQGVRIPFTSVRMGLNLARVSPESNGRVAPEPTSAAANTDIQVETGIIREQILYLAKRFPELKAFMPRSTAGRDVWLSLYEFANDYIALIHPEARETQIRRLLFRLSNSIDDTEYREQITEQIARSDYRHGIVERAGVLRESAPELREDMERSIRDFEEYYESTVPLIDNIQVWRAGRGDIRANSLIDLFSRRPEQVRGKRILHIAPEMAFKDWMAKRVEEWNIEYESLNGFGDGETYQRDICAMGLPADHYDLVICHRVLEHIVDDAQAIAEIYRIIRPEGIFNVSVPQNMNLPDTKEWVVPDFTHAHHVRQYGRDFTDRLRAGGFREVRVEYELLRKSLEEHKRDHTYPMRIYNCIK